MQDAESPEHLNANLVTFFQQFDVDGDGLLSYQEFLLVLALLSVPLRDMQSIFTMMDTDGNGTVEKAEFCRVIDSLEAATSKQASMLPRAGFRACALPHANCSYFTCCGSMLSSLQKCIAQTISECIAQTPASSLGLKLRVQPFLGCWRDSLEAATSNQVSVLPRTGLRACASPMPTAVTRPAVSAALTGVLA